MIDLLFGLSLFLFVYAYLGYPLLIAFLSRSKCQPEQASLPAELPEVTVVLCVYNAGHSIDARLDNLCELDYPAEKLRFVVVSDGSTDDTPKRIAKRQDPRILCLHYEENRGKSCAIAQAIPLLNTPYTLFADGRQRFAPNALKELLQVMLQHKNVAAVTGNLVIASGKGTPGLYWQYEKLIRAAESRYYSLIGVTGAIYLAKTDYLPATLPEGLLLDDMYIPLWMVKQGKTVKFCPSAVAHDTASATLREEFDRKVRTLAGNYQLFRLLPWTLLPQHNPVWFQLVSHKMLRLLVPYLLLLIFISSAVSQHWLVHYAFWAQVGCYAMAAYSYLWVYRKGGKSNVILTFCMLNLAALKASWVHFRSPLRLWKRH